MQSWPLDPKIDFGTIEAVVNRMDGEKCVDCIEEEKFYQETMRGI